MLYSITALRGTFTRSKVNFELKFGRHFVLSFSSGHVTKISKIFGDFVPRDPAFARVFSRRAAILKIVEEKALGTRLPNNFYASFLYGIWIDSFALHSFI